MKFLPTLVLVVTAAASAAAVAETTLSNQAAQERRDRNFDEALTRYRATHGNGDSQAMAGSETTKGDSVRDKSHRAAQSVRNFTHRQADKARNFSARQNARYGTDTKPNTNPEDGVHK